MYVLGAVLSILIGSIYVTYGGASMTLKGMIYNEWLVPLFKDETFASLIFALLFIGVNWIIGYVLYKKENIYKDMIIIADSGSTKTDWCVVNHGKQVKRITTEGTNPFFSDRRGNKPSGKR